MMVAGRLLLLVTLASFCAFLPASGETVLDNLFFAPYDKTRDLLTDLTLAKTVRDACLKDKANCNGQGSSNPYQILWSVYNVLDLDYLHPLIDAYTACEGRSAMIHPRAPLAEQVQAGGGSECNDLQQAG